MGLILFLAPKLEGSSGNKNLTSALSMAFSLAYVLNNVLNDEQTQ